MSNKVIIDYKRDELINFYKKLFELKFGCWILNKTGRSCGYHVAFKFHNINIPDKIYTLYNNPPIKKFNNIEDIKYMIDSKEVKCFDKDLFKNNNVKNKQYSILLKLRGNEFNNRFYICYDYNFSSEDNINYDLEKKDLEFKIYVLKK